MNWEDSGTLEDSTKTFRCACGDVVTEDLLQAHDTRKHLGEMIRLAVDNGSITIPEPGGKVYSQREMELIIELQDISEAVNALGYQGVAQRIARVAEQL